MIIQCKSCSRKFIVKDNDIPKKGREVQCGYCSAKWHQMPGFDQAEVNKKPKIVEAVKKVEENLSVDGIKASDGKTYKFLGSQWAEVMPSGKTGLFARKKISQELNKLIGRKEKKFVKKETKKITKVDPSKSIGTNKNYSATKEGLGFFGYIFLIIIISFSFVGILKTFEDDLINSFPELEYVYLSLDEQLNYLAESVKNTIIIIIDLIKDY
tara:strand:- start:1446 stop:2081 length:636 start_codon:yes stop_codon:yes gene_type:complete